MAKKKQATVSELIKQIQSKLELIEEYAAWTIRADQRFKVGQRVEFSKKALEKKIGPGKHGATKGKLVAFHHGFGVMVLLDGYKKPSGYHHSFFNPVSGPKLF